jgi:hypothetical protein
MRTRTQTQHAAKYNRPDAGVVAVLSFGVYSCNATTFFNHDLARFVSVRRASVSPCVLCFLFIVLPVFFFYL